MKQAGQVLMHGSGDDKKWLGWLTGGRPYIADLKRVTGIGRRIEDDGAATDALGVLAALGKQRIRLVLLMDEFQRVGVLKKEARDTLLSSLARFSAGRRTIFPWSWLVRFADGA